MKTKSKYSYCGTCQDEEWKETGIYDLSELAQIVEKGKEISYFTFKLLVKSFHLKEKIEAAIESGDYNDYLFFINPKRELVWIYDNLEDVEYFYRRINND